MFHALGAAVITMSISAAIMWMGRYGAGSDVGVVAIGGLLIAVGYGVLRRLLDPMDDHAPDDS